MKSLMRALLLAAAALLCTPNFAQAQLVTTSSEEAVCRVFGCCMDDCCGPLTSWDVNVQYCLPNANSAGFNGTHSIDYESGCLSRICCETDCCGDGTEYSELRQECVPLDMEQPGPPTGSPTNEPTDSPTSPPTDSPTESATDSPTPSPTSSPTVTSTDSPTASPTGSPTASSTDSPTTSPTSSPTVSATDSPTASPTGSPTESATDSPTASPTGSPTVSATDSPTASPTGSPTESATDSPTASPTGSPTVSATDSPTASPTGSPTVSATDSPTASPTGSPTVSATDSPTASPTDEEGEVIVANFTTATPNNIFYIQALAITQETVVHVYTPPDGLVFAAVVINDDFSGAQPGGQTCPPAPTDSLAVQDDMAASKGYVTVRLNGQDTIIYVCSQGVIVARCIHVYQTSTVSTSETREGVLVA